MSVLVNLIWFLVGIVAILVELTLFGIMLAIYAKGEDKSPEEVFKDCYEAGFNFLDYIRMLKKTIKQ